MAQPSWSDFLTGGNPPAQQPSWSDFLTGKPSAQQPDVAPVATPVKPAVRADQYDPDAGAMVPKADLGVLSRGIARRAQSVLGAVAANTGTGYTPPELPSPPSKAATSAGEAAMSAFGGKMGAGNIDQASDSAGMQGPADPAIAARLAANDAGSVKAWDSFVTSQIANISGLSPEKVAQVRAQPLPQWGKMGPDGGGTTNFDTKTGDAARVNTGYGSELIRQGKTTVRDAGDGMLHERSNSFSGVGRGEMPQGAAGVFGPDGAPGVTGNGLTGAAGTNPIERVQNHLMGMVQQAEQKRASGDFLGARALRAHALEVAHMFTALSNHAYQQGMLTNAGGELNLRANIAKPGIEQGSIITDQMKSGNLDAAAMVAAAGKGDALHNYTPVMPGYPYIDPRTGQPMTPDVIRALQAQMPQKK